MTSLKPNHLSKAPPPNTITLGLRASTYEHSGHDTHIKAGGKMFLPMRRVLLSSKEELSKGIQIINGLSDYIFFH